MYQHTSRVSFFLYKTLTMVIQWVIKLHSDDGLGETAGEPGAVGFQVELGDLAVLHHHGEPLTPDTAQHGRQIELQLQRLSQLCTGIRQHAHLGVCVLVGTPGLHDKGVIDGHANYFIHTFTLQFLSPGNIAWEVSLAASWCESAWNSEDDDLLARAQLGEVDLSSRIALE